MVTLTSGFTFVSAKNEKRINKLENIESKEVIKNIDKDHNKLFDILENKMLTSSDTDKIPTIVIFNDKLDSAKKTNMQQHLGVLKPKHEFSTIPGMSIDLTKDQINSLRKMDFVKQVEYDMPVYATMDKAKEWFGVNKAVTDFGLNGDRDGNARSYSSQDVVVAVIDTGIDASHVDLDGGKVIGWKDYVASKTTPYDDNGHGTHVSSMIAGEGDGNSSYKGVAPGAALVGLKVLDSSGSGSMSNVTAAIDWAVANKNTYNIKVINMSLGTSGSSDGTDSTSIASNNAVDNGIVVCVAAGNSGPAKSTIGSPGAAEKPITVGAMADVGELGFNIADFSSRGPTADGRIKPDIAAPGYNIMAAKANSTNQYVSYSGTSMATPFTAGTVALMLDANYNLTPTEVKNILTSTAKDWGPAGKDVDYGNGRLDAYDAIKTAGSLTGTNITVPNHLYGSQSILTSRKSDFWSFQVDNTAYPVSISFIIPNWSSSTDLDIYVYDKNNNLVSSSTGTKRQETIKFTPSAVGTYTFKVYSYSGTGNYFFDISAGGSNLTLTGNDQ